MFGPGKLLVATLFFVSLSRYCVGDVNLRLEEKRLLDQILDKYDKRIRPDNSTIRGIDAPVVVQVNIFLRTVDNIDEKKMEMSAQITLRQQWRDNRLRYHRTRGTLKFVQLTDGNLLWKPDTFFQNGKSARVHDTMSENTFFRIYPDGTIQQSTRLSIVVACPMDLSSFPFDTQICSIILASYSHSTDNVVFEWKQPNPVQLADFHNSEFTVTNVTSGDKSSKTNTGIYSAISATFTFRRDTTYYVRNVYVPSIMIIIVSWLSFWIDEQKFTPRIAVSLSTLLVMVVQASKFQESIPPVAYTKSIDIWLGICVFFLFAVVLLVIVVQYFYTPGQDDDEKPARFWKRCCHCATLSKKIDFVARLAYPALFLLFNIIYWPTYASSD